MQMRKQKLLKDFTDEVTKLEEAIKVKAWAIQAGGVLAVVVATTMNV